ncbi:hypothetical protein RUND412_009136, partial [Rhizina undulata]
GFLWVWSSRGKDVSYAFKRTPAPSLLQGASAGTETRRDTYTQMGRPWTHFGEARNSQSRGNIGRRRVKG